MTAGIINVLTQCLTLIGMLWAFSLAGRQFLIWDRHISHIQAISCFTPVRARVFQMGLNSIRCIFSVVTKHDNNKQRLFDAIDIQGNTVISLPASTHLIIAWARIIYYYHDHYTLRNLFSQRLGNVDRITERGLFSIKHFILISWR